jgi:hypothetical protein
MTDLLDPFRGIRALPKERQPLVAFAFLLKYSDAARHLFLPYFGLGAVLESNEAIIEFRVSSDGELLPAQGQGPPSASPSPHSSRWALVESPASTHLVGYLTVEAAGAQVELVSYLDEPSRTRLGHARTLGEAAAELGSERVIYWREVTAMAVTASRTPSWRGRDADLFAGFIGVCTSAYPALVADPQGDRAPAEEQPSSSANRRLPRLVSLATELVLLGAALLNLFHPPGAWRLLGIALPAAAVGTSGVWILLSSRHQPAEAPEQLERTKLRTALETLTAGLVVTILARAFALGQLQTGWPYVAASVVGLTCTFLAARFAAKTAWSNRYLAEVAAAEGMVAARWPTRFTVPRVSGYSAAAAASTTLSISLLTVAIVAPPPSTLAGSWRLTELMPVSGTQVHQRFAVTGEPTGATTWHLSKMGQCRPEGGCSYLVTLTDKDSTSSFVLQPQGGSVWRGDLTQLYDCGDIEHPEIVIQPNGYSMRNTYTMIVPPHSDAQIQLLSSGTPTPEALQRNCSNAYGVYVGRAVRS